jgi:hypothetical protein
MAACLTLNKSDFIRAGPRGAIYLAYRKAIQEVVARHLAEWGDAKNGDEAARQRRARPVERDLQTVLADLADEFPLIAPLVDVRPGGQKKLAARGVDGAGGLLSNRIVVAEAVPVPASVPPAIEPVASEAPEPAAEPPPPRVVLASGGSKRPARFGLSIQFDNRDDASLARLVESVVWVNTANPAYKRAVASHAEGYHIALAVAMALCPLATEPENAHAFITAFLVRWGALVDPRAGRAPRGRPKSR